MSLSYFAQLNITMSSRGASADQFKEMCSILGKIAKGSRRPLYHVVRYTIILMNQNCGRDEAIYKMKTFLRG